MSIAGHNYNSIFSRTKNRFRNKRKLLPQKTKVAVSPFWKGHRATHLCIVFILWNKQRCKVICAVRRAFDDFLDLLICYTRLCSSVKLMTIKQETTLTSCVANCTREGADEHVFLDFDGRCWISCENVSCGYDRGTHDVVKIICHIENVVITSL